jgi:hypothetical protein
MIHLAVRNVYPEVTGVSVDNGSLKCFDIDDNKVIINQDLVDTEITRLQAEYDSQEYAHSRKKAYNALNQFELISDDSINGTTTHKDAILAIKAEFPKP